MNTGLYRGVAAMSVAEKSMDTIASNLASLRTPGSKRRAIASHGFYMGRFGSQEVNVQLEQKNDFTQGTFETSGNQLDLALLGDGFFELDGDDGPIFTRDGEFRMNTDGTLISPEGFAVTWSRQASQLDPSAEEIIVDHQGVVTQGGRDVGTIKTLSFADNHALRHTSDGYFYAPEDLERFESNAEVRQGGLERSNIDPVEELVALITLQRRHERAASIVSQIDQSYRRLTSES